MMESTTLSSHNTYEPIVKRTSRTEPKIQLKPESKIEPKTEPELSMKLKRFTSGEQLRRLHLNKTKRSNEDINVCTIINNKKYSFTDSFFIYSLLQNLFSKYKITIIYLYGPPLLILFIVINNRKKRDIQIAQLS